MQRFHDAGEPSGTAGKPILQYIEGRDLVNACVVVVRYYGGINLGTGGLARAYGSTAKMALDNSHIVPYVEMCELQLTLEYKQLDGFVRELGKINGQLLNKKFAEHVSVIISLPCSEVTALQSRYSQP